MTRPRIGVLALQGDVVEHEDALRRGGAEPVRVRRVGELESVAGLVLPGGESTTIGKLLAVFELLEPLRLRIAAGLPVFGSCAGMILLADKVLDGAPDQVMLGGMDIAVRRNAFGRQVESFECELDVAGLGAPSITGVFIRAPWVESVGPKVEVLASVDGHPVAVRQGSMLATSFHPEMTDDNRLHALFISMATLPRTRRTETTGETHA